MVALYNYNEYVRVPRWVAPMVSDPEMHDVHIKFFYADRIIWTPTPMSATDPYKWHHVIDVHTGVARWMRAPDMDPDD